MRAAVGVALVLAACPTSAPSDEEPGADPEGLTRGCDSAVFGDPNLENATRVGPLALVGIGEAATLPPRAFRERNGRFQAIKILAVVMGSKDVIVTLPTSQRAHVALLYDPRAKGNKYGFPFSAGDFRVTFRACPPNDAQYNGGFMAKLPICVRLEVESGGAELTPGWLSLGAGFPCHT
jgi:hypothetical protein